MSKLYYEADSLNADAVIGIRFKSVSAKDKLKLIVYGTAVKYK